MTKASASHEAPVRGPQHDAIDLMLGERRTDRTDVAPLIREARLDDIPAMHAIRLSVRENVLRSADVTEAAYVAAITTNGKGWVVEEGGVVVGFAVGDRDTGNIWALFVRPEHEARGHGKALLGALLEWMFARGLQRAWLTTQPGTRAERFYRNRGWRFVRIRANGEAEFELCSRDAPRRRDVELSRR